MTVSTRTTASLAALGLVGSSLLAPPALAMNDLAQGYALAAASAPPTARAAPTPPPTDAATHAEGKCGAEHKQAEGNCGADHKHAEGKCGTAPAKATEGQAATDQAAQADKGMEGKCGEGKCGGSP